MPLVLASASPRRQELLHQAGIEFVVRPANILEIHRAGESPRAFAERMAKEKAQTAWETLESPSSVLGADTVVVIGTEVLGKPADSADAARMLRRLSGREHSVITGVCLIGKGFQDVRSEVTAVHFSRVSDSDIAHYVSSGEPMDKAGAYAIQGGASKWISKIEGDYNNVVGLPVDLVKKMLREHGLD